MSDAYAVVGRVRKPHGIRGEVIVEPYTDAPDAVFAAGRRVFRGTAEAALLDDAPIDVIGGRPFKNVWLVSLGGVRDRNAAELWRDVFLLLPSADLDPPSDGEVWVHELAGMRVVDPDGSAIGIVQGVTRLPHGLLLEVTTPVGAVSVPFVDAIVTRVDRAAREITAALPAGLLEL